MSDASIQPALTAEEWGDRFVRIQVTDYDSDQNAAGELHAGPGYIHLSEHQYPRFGVFDEPPILHALMALANNALQGQPFGFTREDVAVVQSAALLIASIVPLKGHAETRIAAIDRLRSLADRIEALLPPETPTGGTHE